MFINIKFKQSIIWNHQSQYNKPLDSVISRLQEEQNFWRQAGWAGLSQVGRVCVVGRVVGVGWYKGVMKVLYNQYSMNRNQQYYLSYEEAKYPNYILTPSQLMFLSRMLPPNYSLQSVPKNERKVDMGRPYRNKRAKNIEFFEQENDVSQEPKKLPANKAAKKSKSVLQIEQIQSSIYANYNNYVLQKELSRKNVYEDLDPQLKPCVRVLNLLKSNKTSWAFRQPVDAVAMGVPHYNDIIKQPMDLSKVQSKLKGNLYATPTQFHADINKIIQNSYLFNQQSIEYSQMTSEFEHFYKKVIGEIGPDDSPNKRLVTHSYEPRKKESKIQKAKRRPEPNLYSQQLPVTLAEKKELSANIRKLKKEHMRGLVDIVYQEGQNVREEIDLEDLPARKIRALQEYVRRMGGSQEPRRAQVGQEQENKESEFEMDSDQES